jgi:hypothetical protein
VLEGSLSVFISPPEGKEYLVKRIEQGNSFFSLLSMIDILSSTPSIFKTVSLKATKPSRVARYCMLRFRDAYDHNPALWIRPIQVVLTRLLHVTMTTLHEHLGLGKELMKRRVGGETVSVAGGGPLDDRQRNTSGHSFRASGRYKSRQRRLSSSDSTSEHQLNKAVRWFGEALRLPANVAPALLHSRIQVRSHLTTILNLRFRCKCWRRTNW